MNMLQAKNEKPPIEVMLKVDNNGYTDSKNLYEFLKLDVSHYSGWCKTNILENPFAEFEKDYYSPSVASKGKGCFAEVYKLSSDFAKKLSMMQKSERGERARQYFWYLPLFVLCCYICM